VSALLQESASKQVVGKTVCVSLLLHGMISKHLLGRVCVCVTSSPGEGK
jgi:hypothetical protein